MNFHEYILKLRQERGLKQSDVASSIGVTVRAYQAYEYGKSEPRMSTLIALAGKTLHVNQNLLERNASVHYNEVQ